MLSILSILHRNWNVQVLEIILSRITNSIWPIWFCRNVAKFDNMNVTTDAAINLAIGNISLFESLSHGHSTISATDELTLNRFSVAAKVNKAPIIKEVIWKAPSFNLIKCNTGGAAKGALELAACGSIFRDKNATTLGVLCSQHWKLLCFVGRA